VVVVVELLGALGTARAAIRAAAALASVEAGAVGLADLHALLATCARAGDLGTGNADVAAGAGAGGRAGVDDAAATAGRKHQGNGERLP
jgi:hypothetical protein